MRLPLHWKTVFQTILVAIFMPGKQIWHSGCEDGDRAYFAQTTPIRAFLLAFGYPIVDEYLARKIRAAQIRGITRLTPFTILANIVNVLVIIPISLPIFPAFYVFVWAAALIGVVSYMGWHWFKGRSKRIETVSRKALAGAVKHATVLSVFWAMVPIAAFAHGDTNLVWIASCITIGMLCAGGFALATVPHAAFRWVVILYSASVISLVVGDVPQIGPLTFLLTCYALVIIGSTASAAWLFASHFLVEGELDQRTELIALLLNEFEEKESDWLWETDSVGQLRNISDRFLHASGRTQKALRSMRMMDLAYTVEDNDAREAVIELQTVYYDEQPFRDIVIGVDVNSEVRWWSLAGRPVYDHRGNFMGYRGVASDITETRRANALIEHMAERDFLTGIGNRSWFLKQAETLLSEQLESGQETLTLFLIDLDNFKVVNDTSGHPAGDEVLKQVTSRFKAISQGKTILARFGGDEFAALGQFVSEQAAEVFAEGLVNVTRKPFRIGTRDFAIGATVGFARIRKDRDTVSDLMRRSDIALYKAKESGRGRALAFENEMELEVRERRELESDLREAFEFNKLTVEFQPIVGARSGQVVSSEVLVRWIHPERGDVSPDVFIPIAEHAGLILPLGSWVLKHACSVAAQCPDLQSIAVNLSPIQFMDPNLVEMVSSILTETGFPADRLVLEITESVFLKDVGSASHKLEQLRDMGIRIALDDFGTGYSSLSYLRQYKFDKIKIDKSFVDEIGERSDGLAIISAVIALAHNLGLEVTAEGVERQFQVDALRTLGCDSMQGYYFGKPDPNPLKITHIKKKDWEDRAPSTAPENPGVASVS
ncbi:MAG: EAL domain-containing protein [Roseibium sp.]